MEFFNPKILFNSLVYSIIGVIVFWVSFVIVDKFTPYELWKEIVERKNQPLAIVVAAPAKLAVLPLYIVLGMMALKYAFDPKGLLNPGKVIPELHRCAEYGRMHVKRGLLAFPELERF